MKKIIMVITFFAITGTVFAQATSTSMQGIREEFRDARQNVIEMRKEAVSTLKAEIKTAHEDALKMFQTQRDEFRSKMEAIREGVKQKIEQARTKLQNKVHELRDTRREEIVTRVSDNLDKLNTRWTGHFSDVLDQVGTVLARIKGRTDDAVTKGVNVADVQTAITAADAAIKSAEDAIKIQSGKTYPIIWTASTTPSVVKDAVQSARDALRKDLEAVRALVESARDAVHAAAVMLGKVRGMETPTSTATTSNP